MNISVNGKPDQTPDDTPLNTLIRASTGCESAVGVAVDERQHGFASAKAEQRPAAEALEHPPSRGGGGAEGG